VFLTSNLFVTEVSSVSTDFMLMNVFLDDPTYDLLAPTGTGSFFTISITKSRDLLHHGIMSGDATDFPELIALIIPLFERSIPTESGQILLTSMAMEIAWEIQRVAFSLTSSRKEQKT